MDENSDPNRCASSESAASSDSKQTKKPVGRPRKLCHTNSQDTKPALKVAVQAVASHLRKNTSLSDPVLSLQIPNQLLLQWRSEIQSSSVRLSYISRVNESVAGGAVLLRHESERLERVLRARASTVHSQVAKAKGSRSREVRLNSSCVVVVDRSDVVAVASLEKETIVLKEKVAEANTKIEDALKSVDEVHQEFATQCATYLETIEKQADELKVKKDFVNRGRVFDEVGERQKRRKLSDFGDSTKKALWFAESFGFKLKSIEVESQSGSAITLPLCTELQPQEDQPSSVDNSEITRATLYLLDKFAVSDEFYHELSMSYKDLPRSYKIKDLRSTMSRDIRVVRLGASFHGAYRPFEDLLALCLSRELERNPEHQGSVCVKLSGDGARFSKSTSLIFLTFSFPFLAKDVLAGSGNHTYAAIKGEESYELISQGLGGVIVEVNRVIEKGSVLVGGQDVKLEFYLGSDYKFLLLVLGMNAPTSDYACIWCTIHKDFRWDMDVALVVYCQDQARTLESLRKGSKHSHKDKRKGAVNPPLFNIELDHIILDELHLLLRVVGVLLRNLIYEVLRVDGSTKERGVTVMQTHLSMLVDAIRSCGVSFKVWRAKDENGYASKSGKYDWTALSGNELKKVLKDLPPKIFTFLPPDISETVVKIWNDFSVIYYMLALPDSKEVDVLQEKAKDWVRLFLSLQDRCEGHQKKSITPYIHALVYHVPEMIRRLGSIKPFSGQGVEKNNDDAKKNYYSSNRHDPCGDILVTEGRIEELADTAREKRTYTKRDHQYWEGGGIQEARKKHRPNENTLN